MRFVVLGCLCAGALATLGCADASGVPTGPSATAAVTGLAATAPGADETMGSTSAAPRSGALRLTKICPPTTYTGEPGSYCTITASNVPAIDVDSRIVYLQGDQVETPASSDVILDLPGPGNNKAFGHCSVANAVCTFSGGTGKFTHFRASAAVSHAPDYSLWYWDGTYSFSPKD